MHRRGPARTLPVLAGGYGLVLTVVALAGGHLGSTPVALPALCALAGCLTPPLVPTTRSVWSTVAPHPDLLRRAYSLDAAADEVLFTLGPLVGGFAATLAGPGAAVLLTAAIAVAGTLGVAVSPLVRALPPAATRPTGRRSVAPLRAPGFVRLLTVMFGVGTALGGVELVAVAVGGHGGGSAGTGTLVATVALGGAVGSVVYGRRAWSGAPASQLCVLCAALTCALLTALATIGHPALLPLALFLSGLVIAPALIIGYGTADRLTDRAVHPEAGALVSTANNLGASIGTAATALVLDRVGVPAALLVAVAAALATMSLSRRRWAARLTPAVHSPAGQSSPLQSLASTAPATGVTSILDNQDRAGKLQLRTGAGDGNRTRVASLEGRRHLPPWPLPATTPAAAPSAGAHDHFHRPRFVSRSVSRIRSNQK